ncbi:MAG: thymidylate synthase [Alteromonadaceae bacterium]|jgi:thymidylate synthase
MIISNPCIEVWFILHFELLQKSFAKNKNSKAINCKHHLRDNHIADYEENIDGLYLRLKAREQQAHQNVEKLKLNNKTLGINNLDTDIHIICNHLKAIKEK